MKNTVEIPIEEYEALKALAATVETLTAQLAQQQEQLVWLNKQVFGQKSERLTDMPGDTPDIPGLEIPTNVEPEPEITTVPKHKRKKKKKKTGDFKLELPDDLEEVEVHLDPPEEERMMPDGRKLVRIDEERVKKLAYRPSEYYAKVFVKGIWILPGDATITPVQEPMSDDIAHGSKFDISFYAHLAVEKFCFHMPINRIQEKLAGRDIQASRQHLSQALSRCGDSIVPLVELMKKEVLDSGVIFTDETPVKLQQKKKCKEGRVWVYGGGKPPNGSKIPPYLVYQFTDGRSYDYPKKYLEKFSGILHADAYGVYEQLDKDLKKDICWAACWAHARREFLKAINLNAEFKRWILRKIRYLFMFERLAWKGDAGRRLFIRNRYERPIVSEIYARLKQEALKPIHLPSSKAGKAINYMLKREKNFTLYLDHARVHMDNNISERALRKIAVGRKNWLFFGSEQAAEKQMGLLSLIQTCRNLGIKPQEYLQDVFSRILTHPAARLAELLPDQWKASHETEASKQQ